MSVVPAFLLIICPVAALLFLARLVSAAISSKVSGQMQRHPIIHLIWGCFAIVGALVFTGTLDPGAWPPASIERRTQRQKVLDRVEGAGGWEALRRECIAFAETNEMIQWSRWHTNDSPALPPILMALQPQQVYYVSPKVLGPLSGEPKIPIIRIKVFGMHSTGGHSIPYFGLEVIATSSPVDYTPKASPAASGNGHLDHRKVSEGVYEIY
jgi:hypothetical protein